MPQMNRVSAAARVKVLAREERARPPFLRWNAAEGRYEFILEIYDNRTGDKYQVVASQLEWEGYWAGLTDAFEKAPA